MSEKTLSRKEEHLKICLNEEVETSTPLFENVILKHEALPEINFNEISTETIFLGKKFSMPLMIAACTGGIAKAEEINRAFAKACEEKGIGMGFGSQRAMIENPSKTSSYKVRDVAPDIFLGGNIGISQIKQFTTKQIQNAMEAIDADALFVHLNVAQEFFQKDDERDTDFSNNLEALSRLCDELSIPVIAKEVGNGVSKKTAVKLKQAGVKAIDVGGSGGTSWIVVDSLRSGKNAELFKNWGIPTAASIIEAREASLPLIATGGVRTGLDIAKSIALGAHLTGIALPFLRTYHSKGEKGLIDYINKLEEELKTAMFFTGSKNVEQLKEKDYVLTGKLLEWKKQI